MNFADQQGRPERFSGGQLTVAAFEALGVQPLLGRGFREGDDRPGAEPVMLLSYELWRDRYGSSPDIVGQAIRANGVQRMVIGVMPEKFAFPIREALWTPLVDRSARHQERAGPELPGHRPPQTGRQHRSGESAGSRASARSSRMSSRRPTAASAPT